MRLCLQTLCFQEGGVLGGGWGSCVFTISIHREHARVNHWKSGPFGSFHLQTVTVLFRCHTHTVCAVGFSTGSHIRSFNRYSFSIVVQCLASVYYSCFCVCVCDCFTCNVYLDDVYRSFRCMCVYWYTNNLLKLNKTIDLTNKNSNWCLSQWHRYSLCNNAHAPSEVLHIQLAMPIIILVLHVPGTAMIRIHESVVRVSGN